MPSRHGRPDRILVARTANAKECSRCRLKFGRRRGSGAVLARYIALAHRGTSLTPGTCSGPPQCPRVQQSQQNAPEVPRRANFLATVACSMEEGDVRRDSFWKGGDLRRPVRQRGMDYLRALLVTPYD
jgi:hypothetical protein